EVGEARIGAVVLLAQDIVVEHAYAGNLPRYSALVVGRAGPQCIEQRDQRLMGRAGARLLIGTVMVV
ncbi:MAG: hypothetical protein Q8K90_01795, partial [Brevundimonas sp.]|nr:hypothetical protein [Brevundimonas sp.]